MAGTRRGNGEADITQLPSGSYRAQGRRHSVTGKTKEEVKRKRRELLSNADRGIVPAREQYTLEAFSARWLRDVVRHGLRPATYRSYEELMRLYILPDLGACQLTKLQPAHLSALNGELLDNGRRTVPGGKRTGRPLAPQTVRNAHLCLHVALEQALKWNLVSRNVADAVSPPTVARRELETLSPQAIKHLLQATAGTRWGTLIDVAVNTGMRQGELLGLRWRDLELDAGLLRVHQQYGRDGTMAEPKTRRSRRAIDLPAPTVAALREHKVRQLEERLIAGADWVDHDLVFSTYQGRPLGHRNVGRMWGDCLKRLGMRHREFHAMRHTHATLLLAAGVPVVDVSARLGHSSPSITMDVYGHVMPDAGRNIAARLEALLA